jgi:hypothetical protein
LRILHPETPPRESRLPGIRRGTFAAASSAGLGAARAARFVIKLGAIARTERAKLAQ